jgi:glycosyltransferase involved in cell wall biosynthesis
MTTLAVSFTNLGPYHLARLRALAARLGRDGGRLIAYETAGAERKYAWRVGRDAEPFDWITLFPDAALESIPGRACARAMIEALGRDRPDAVGLVGYVRPECLAALRWAEGCGRPAILMSESQAIDRPRHWWREAVKRWRVRRFSAALVGGPRHRQYLVELGLPADRIALGYNAVDNAYYAALAAAERCTGSRRPEVPAHRYFLSVARFVPEKNLCRLVRAFGRYRDRVPAETAWDLVLCGDGPGADEVELSIRSCGHAGSIHRPGFLQADELAKWYAFAGAFVLASVSEPWGLVANEAAASGLPLLVSDRCGCAETLVPDPPGQTGWRFDPCDEPGLARLLHHMAALPEPTRAVLGRRAAEVVAPWGPERFAMGTLEALDLARRSRQPLRRPAAVGSFA